LGVFAPIWVPTNPVGESNGVSVHRLACPANSFNIGGIHMVTAESQSACLAAEKVLRCHLLSRLRYSQMTEASLSLMNIPRET
jgi:hypothetical protein